MTEAILVYADFAGSISPTLLGRLHIRRLRSAERMEFEYDEHALASPLAAIQFDPRIGPYAGRQFPPAGTERFGLVADASPDRWGETLMRRRHEQDTRAGLVSTGTQLNPSDYLLGVHDYYRVGALRFKVDPNGPFLDNQNGRGAPPLTRLRELEEAARRFEDGETLGSEGQDWLSMLIAPGGSLGGARPKASVIDEADNSLWIAKFPSNRDTYDLGGWEMLVNVLANGCGLNVAQGAHGKYNNDYHCFRVKRFDRTHAGERLHFASAMTLTGHQDGDDHMSGASYLEIAEVLIRHGSNTTEDLRELWCRIVFNMLVSNTDDHLRNHGFLLDASLGWRLSPAYDINPVPGDTGLKLNVSEADNSIDLSLALAVADRFRVPQAEAKALISTFKGTISQWRKVAQAIGLSRQEMQMMAPAFSLAMQ